MSRIGSRRAVHAYVTLLLFVCCVPMFSAIDLSLDGLPASKGFRIQGPGSDQLGYSVSKAGDVNGDGIEDIIVGAHIGDPTADSNAGITYVIYGRNVAGGATPFANIQLVNSALPPTVGFRILGASAGDLCGYSVNGVGDVNGDEVDDIIVGARSANKAYVVFGRSIPNGGTPFSDIQLPGIAMNALLGFRILGASGSDLIGGAVSAAGDMNGDGIADILVGVGDANKAYVIWGKDVANGAGNFGDIQLVANNMNPAVGFLILGVQAGDEFGSSVNCLKDINGDGMSDIIVGASSADAAAQVNIGIAYIIYGRNLAVGGTPFGDLQMVAGAMDPLIGFRILGATAGDSLNSCSDAGDVNDDGLNDLIVGSGSARSPSAISVGVACVIFGRNVPGGAVAFGDIQLTTNALPVDVGFRIIGATSSDYLGISASSAGDVNKDNVDDIVIGAYQADPNGMNTAGISYVIYGRKIAGSVPPFGDILLQDSSMADDVGFRILGAEINDQAGYSVSSAGDLNNDGISDVLMGAYYNSKAYIVFGTAPPPSSQPSSQPSRQPSMQPSRQPTSQPSGQPSRQPRAVPSSQPSRQPTLQPSAQPSDQPSRQPSNQPFPQPSGQPSQQPSAQPTAKPSRQPSSQPSAQPSRQPSNQPSSRPTVHPTVQPSLQPSGQPTLQPSDRPSSQPSRQPSVQPSFQPSVQPSRQPLNFPTSQPSCEPSAQSSQQPSTQPSQQPSARPSMQPSAQPSVQPAERPSQQPSCQPTEKPSSQPSALPTTQPSIQPSSQPSCQSLVFPTVQPSQQPTEQPSSLPTAAPSTQPSQNPSNQPSDKPTSQPIAPPSRQPSGCPSNQPTVQPSSTPSAQPTSFPTTQPSTQPGCQPSDGPTALPTVQPTSQPTHKPSLLPPNTVANEEGVTFLPASVSSIQMTYTDNAIYACGTSTISAVCFRIESNGNVQTFTLPFSSTTFTAQGDRTRNILVGGRGSDTSVASAEISMCAVAELQLICEVTSYADASYAAGTYVPFVERQLYVGAFRAVAIVTVVEQGTGRQRSYIYSSIKMKTLELLKSKSPPNFIGSVVTGLCVNLASTNYIFAGMVRTDSGIMTAMSLAPVNGIILNSAELVNAMALENLVLDSFIAGGLALNNDVGMHAFLLRVNTLYYSVLYGMRYRIHSVDDSSRRLSQDDTTFSSVGKGLLLVDDTLYMIVQCYTAHNTTALSVLQIQMTTGNLISQVQIASDTANLSCSDIISAGLHLVIACTVQYNFTTNSSILLSANKDLSFFKLPEGFTRDIQATFVAERVSFHRTVLPISVQSASTYANAYAFRTGDNAATRSPIPAPTVSPSVLPSSAPSGQPSSSPTATPSVSPQPTSQPSSSGPTNTYKPTVKPTLRPTTVPSTAPSMSPSRSPSITHTARPTYKPSANPSTYPSKAPNHAPSRGPTCNPTRKPSTSPTTHPSSIAPSAALTDSPTVVKSAGSSVLPTQQLVLIIVGAVAGAMVLILLLNKLYRMFLSCVGMVVREERRVEFALKYDDAAVAKPRWWYPYLSSFISFVLCVPKEGPGKIDNSNNNSQGAPPAPVAAPETDVSTSSTYMGRGAYAVGPASAVFHDLEANNTLPVAKNKSSTAAAADVAGSSSSDGSVYLSSESTHSSVFDEPSELTENSGDYNTYSDHEYSEGEETDLSVDGAGTTSDSDAPSGPITASTESKRRLAVG